MEQPFKRRRVSLRDESILRETNAYDLRPKWNKFGLEKETTRGREQPLPKNTPSGAFDGTNRSPNPFEPRYPGNEIHPALHPRHLTNRQSAVAPTSTAVVSVVEVDIQLEDAAVTELLVPAASSIVSVPGHGPVTLSNNPAIPSSSSQTPVLRATSSAVAPQSTQTSAAFSQAVPSPTPPVSSSPAASASRDTKSQVYATPTFTSMTLNLQRLSSQEVLSPSPSSPLPLSPAGSLSSSSTSASFFPSSAGTSSQSNPTQTSSSRESPSAPSSTNPSATTSRSLSSSAPLSASASASASATLTGTDTDSSTSRSSNSKRTTSANSPTSRTDFATSITTTTSTTSTASRTSASSSRSKSSRPSSTRGTSTSTSKSTSTSSRTTSARSSLTTSITSQPSETLAPLSTITSSGTAGGAGGYGGASGTGSGVSTSSTATAGAGAGSGGGGLTPATRAVVGGVVGGLAGLSIVFLLLLLLIRWRRNKARLRRPIFSPLPQHIPPGEAGQGGTMTERSSAVPLAAGGFFRRLRPHSGQTAATSDTGPSERGFQNFGGRKLESVLSSRGDGYGEPGSSSAAGPAAGFGSTHSVSRGQGFGHSPGPSEPETLSGSSFYRDSQGFYGGKEADSESGPSSLVIRPGSPTHPHPSAGGLPPEGGAGVSRATGEIAVMRPGPARTPVTNQPGFVPLRNPPRPPRSTPSPRPPRGTPPPRASPIAISPISRPPDELGRSHPSFDGSRGSRFTEEV